VPIIPTRPGGFVSRPSVFFAGLRNSRIRGENFRSFLIYVIEKLSFALIVSSIEFKVRRFG
jgi:hypothetical protein